MSKSIAKISNISKNASSTSKINDKKIGKESKTQSTSKITKTKTEIQKKSTIKNDEKEIPNKLQSKLPSNSRISTVTTNKTALSIRNSKTDSKPQPIRAKYTPEIVNSLKNSQNRSISNKNVMNTVHNVTVLSPPARRKQITTVTNSQTQNKIDTETKLTKVPKQNDRTDIRTRTRTRTLDPDEVIILKKPSSTNTGPKSLDSFVGRSVKEGANQEKQPSMGKDLNSNLKEPVAFEIILDEKNAKSKGRIEAKRPSEKKSTENISKLVQSSVSRESEKRTEKDETDEYEEDFESYESDFETGSSSAEASEISAETPTTEDENTETETGTENDLEGDGESSDKVQNFDETDCDESEETQPPITVIHKEKEDERKLDSGNYDMHSRREKSQQQQQHQQQQLDSIDTITGNSEQLDSGISYNGVNTGHLSVSSLSKSASATSSVFLSGIFHHVTQISSKMAKRGIELMKKIQLDTVDYVLFDLKPISYEHYMKMYGNVNAIQATTQTNENQMSTEVQTDDCQYRSMWTQHPPQYDLGFVQNNILRNSLNCCGEFDEEIDGISNGNHPNSPDTIHRNNDALMKSLKALQKFRRDELKRTEQIQKPINFDTLNDFLNRTVFTVSRILNKTTNQDHKKVHNPKDSNVSTDISKGYYVLNTNFLNALRVIKIFSNSNLNLILAVHESLDDGLYKSEFLNLISVWTTNDSEKPIRLLSTWSEVSRADICSENSDIVVCGLRDGSIAIWDLRETYSFCSKLDGYLRHFPATQSITPILPLPSSSSMKAVPNDSQSMMTTDLGAVVDIKSFRKSNKIYEFKTYKPIQLVSLNDSGILTIWTLVETGNAKNLHLFDDIKIKNPTKRKTIMKIEYNSPWARVKLIQSEICDLRSYLELKNLRIKSAFEKTKSYFENDLFNDDVLKELQGLTTNTITQQNEEFKFSVKGLRFINLDTDLDERIFIGTNRNFIIKCTKTLRSDQFCKIVFNETKFLFATTFRVLKTGEFLLIGLSNGSVMAVNCSSNKMNKNLVQSDNNEMDDLSNAATNFHKKSDDDDYEFDVDNGGKSCTIQNIIRNERRAYEVNAISDSIQNTFDETSTDQQQGNDENDFLYHIYDQQILLDGSILRKNLVQQIEFSDDSRKLFVLTDGHLRIYDFMTDKEVITIQSSDNNRDNNSIIGLTMTKHTASDQNLIVLTKGNEVQVHTLK